MRKIFTKSAGLFGALLLLAVSASATPPVGTPGSSLLYVNDASPTGDAYTSAVGSSTGDGSRNNPFDNIASAIAVAGSGATIYVDAGTYNVSTSMTIPAGVRLVGLCASSSTIVLGNNAPNTINVSDNAELSRFTITRIAPIAPSGQTSVAVSTTPGGINMKINNCLFTKCRTAINVNGTTGNPSAIIEKNDFNDNRTGIIMNSPAIANMQITGNNIVNNRTFGILFASGTTFSNIIISNNNITGNLASNVEVDGSAAANSITFENNWVGSANPIVTSGTVNGGFTVDDHNTGTSYPNVNFMDNNGSAPPNYPNAVSGTNTGALALNGTSFASSARPFALSSCCVVATTNATGSNTAGGFLTIQDAVDNSNPGATITLCAATYNEQVLVNKSVTIQGTGTLQSVVNFTGTAAGKPTLFDVSAPNVTINNISFKTNLSTLSSAVVASGANISNLAVTNNSIEPYGSTAANSSYANRNAISINYANYRVAGANTNGANISGNTISGLAATATGAMNVARYFRSGVSADEVGGTFSGNTIQSINHDVLLRFASQGAVNITNNNFNGGGAEVSDINSGSGVISVTGNTFDATFANTAAANTAVLRLKNNGNSKTTLVSGNTFRNHEWAVSTENYNTVTLSNNTFTPLANSTTYHHVTVNTKCINTNSASIVQVPVSATLTANTFNGSGAAGGTAVGFYNHDNDNAAFGTFVLGTAGAENNFAAGIAENIHLDQQSGPSSPSTTSFPNYDAVIGNSAGATTTKAPWAASIDATNNRFDVGNGLETPAAMSLANLYLLENKIQHKIDLGTLGFVTVKAANTYVTPASFVAPNTTAGSVQRGVDAASDGFTVNVAAGTFNGTTAVDKDLTLRGANAGTSGLGIRGSESNLVSSPNCIVLATGKTLTVDGFAFNGRSFIQGGTSNGLSVLNCKITTDAPINSNCIYVGQPFTTFNVLNNDISMTGNCQATIQPVGLYAGSGTDNKVNISGNRFTTTVAANATGGRPVAVNLSNVQGMVTQNEFTGIDIGVLVANGSGTLDISQNVFDGLVRPATETANNSFAAGVVLFQLSTSGTAITIRNNEFKASDAGVRTSLTSDFSSHPVNISDNSFTNTGFFHLRNAAGTGTFNATCNWFGTTNATAVASKISGSVTYIPYRTDGSDTSAAIGFQPGTPCAGPCNITASVATTQTTCPATNGTATVTVGGTSVAPYVYTLGSTSQSGNVFTGLTPGTYAVTVTDNTGCTATSSATITISGPVHNTTTGVDYCTIQEAVTAASTANIITVDAGTYDISSGVTITKGIQIRGASFGTSGTASARASETILVDNRTPASNPGAFGINTTDSVTIDGITLQGSKIVVGQPANAKLTFSNDRMILAAVPNAGQTGMIFSTGCVVRLDNNYIQTTGFNASNSALLQIAGGYSVSSTVDKAIITNNVFKGVPNFGTYNNGNGQSTLQVNLSNCQGTISNNTFDSVDIGVLLGDQCGNVAISSNTFKNIKRTAQDMASGFYGSGIVFYNPSFVAPVSISGNTFQNSDCGIRTSTDGSAFTETGSNLSFAGNAFSGNTYDLVNKFPAVTFNLNGDNTFAGTPLSAATKAQLFSVEDKIVHKIDRANYGFVNFKANNVYVTPGSFFVPGGTNTPSIQRGIDAAANGFTVNVAAGTFNEAVTVNKEVTVSGAQAGILAKTRTGAESVVDPNATNDNVFTITKDNVTIDGFTITNSTALPTAQERSGVLSITKTGTGNFTNLSVKNNIISRQFKGINFNQTNNFNISQNWLHGEGNPRNNSSLWVASYGTSSNNGAITNNDMDGYLSAVEIQGNGSQPVSNLTITENRSTGSQYVFFGLQGSAVSRNTVLNVTTGSHVFIGGGCSSSTFTRNFFDGGSFSGVSISNDFGAGTNAGLTFNENSITGHNNAGRFEIRVTPGSYTDSLMATCNWFGTISSSAIAAKISGPVKYSPFLSNGTDNETATAGFQPVPGSCTGNNNSPAITCPGTVATCQNTTGNYTIPVLNASDNCGSHTTTYAITGATTRNGMGENASGAFNVGTSNLTYTVTDGCGNISNCATTITINATPVTVTASPLYTVSGQEIQTIYLNYPAAGGNSGPITLSVPGAGAGANYTWTKAGCNASNPTNLNNNSNQYVFNATAADAPGNTATSTPDNVYRFTVTVTSGAGCFSTAEKIVNVVNPRLDNGNYNVCHKTTTRGNTSASVQQVAANQLSAHVAHGDILGNCSLFTGSCPNVAAKLASGETTETEEATAFEEIAEARVVSVYPNPTTTGTFVVKLSHVTEEATIVITDIQGRAVATQTLGKDGTLMATFDLSTLAGGMYLIQLRDGDFRYNTKIVVQQ